MSKIVTKLQFGFSKDANGIFNVGTGKSIKFVEVANSIIKRWDMEKLNMLVFQKI